MKILCLCLPGMGDCLMFTPTLKLLRRQFPSAEIDVLTMMRSCHDVLLHNKNLNRVLYYPLMDDRRGGVRFLLGLRGKYDVTIMAYPQYRREYHVVSYLIGAKRRIGHKWKVGSITELHFLNESVIPVFESSHNVINNLNLLHSLGISWEDVLSKDDIHYDLAIDEKSRSAAQSFLESNGLDKSEYLVGMHPGSTPSPAAILRRWPLERYVVVAENLVRKRGAKILVFTGAWEKDAARALKNLSKDDVVVADGLPTLVCCALVAKCDLFIGNDNGFGHIAAAMNTPLITLWDSTNPTWSLPWGKSVSLIKTSQNPWYRYELKRSAVGPGRMSDITVEQVLRRIPKMTR